MMPLATVIIPTHDHADTIPYAVASVQAQTVQDFELFVVGDDAPARTDAVMAALCAADARIRYVANPKGAGHGEAHRAQALGQAAGRIVCYLGDDDLWLADHLETMAALLTNADFAHTSQVNVRADGSVMVPAGDLQVAALRRRMQEQKWNFFGPTSAGHTLEAYRKLPAGWRPRPDGMFSDLHMWRQWLAQPWCRFHSEPALTTLHFPASLRKGWSVAERVGELERWWARIREPDFKPWLERERLLDWQRRCEQPAFYFDLAKTLEELGDSERAEALYRRAISIDAVNPRYHRRLSSVLLKRGADEEALAAAKTAAELAPEDPNLGHYLGVLLARLQRWDEAALAHARAIELDPAVGRFHYQAGRCLEKLGRLKEARFHAAKAVDLEPEQLPFHHYLERLQARG
jgi:tetratricopeptide (TPR) repeat protein